MRAKRCTCGEPELPGQPHNHPEKRKGQIKPFNSPDAEMTKGLEVQASTVTPTQWASEMRRAYSPAKGTGAANAVLHLCTIVDQQAEQIKAKDEAIARCSGYADLLPHVVNQILEQALKGWSKMSKLHWSKDSDGWTGTLLPWFAVYKDCKGCGYVLDIIDPRKAPEHQHRQVPVDSVHQAKCIAAGIVVKLGSIPNDRDERRPDGAV